MSIRLEEHLGVYCESRISYPRPALLGSYFLREGTALCKLRGERANEKFLYIRLGGGFFMARMKTQTQRIIMNFECVPMQYESYYFRSTVFCVCD